MKIGVLIPLYNGLPYIKSSLNSILSQTYTDIKIYVVDDGSTDGSKEYVESLEDDRIELIQQAHGGITSALNRVIKMTDCDWLVRHDADDISKPDRIENVVECIKENSSAGLIYSDVRFFTGENGSIKLGPKFKLAKGSPQELKKILKTGYLLSISHPGATLNVEKVRKVGGYRFNLHVEDIDLWWRLGLRYDLVYYDSCDVLMRAHSNSISSQNFRSQLLNMLFIQYLLLCNLRDLKPQNYESFLELVDGSKKIDRYIYYRNVLKKANNAWGKDLFKTLHFLIKAMSISPIRLSKRFLYELGVEFEKGRYGVNPKLIEQLMRGGV